MGKTPSEVLIRAIMYKVTVVDDCVIFAEVSPVFGCKSRVMFYVAAGCWWFETDRRMMASHVIEMNQLVEEWFGKNHYISAEIDAERRNRK